MQFTGRSCCKGTIQFSTIQIVRALCASLKSLATRKITESALASPSVSGLSFDPDLRIRHGR
jgi:hypothetical protein